MTETKEPREKLPRDAFPPEVIATPPTSAPYIDTLLVNVTLGPWSGSVLHLPNADAMQAITDKWAVLSKDAQPPVDPNAAPPTPLTPEETNAAIAAAEAYAAAQQQPPEGAPGKSPPSKVRTEPTRRDMHAADTGRGSYETKDQPTRR